MADNTRYRNYVPALDDVLSPPPEPAPDAPRIHNEVRAETAWLILTTANVLVTVIIIAAMLVDGTATKRAVLYGILYFAPTTTVFVLALTGTLTDIVRGAQREKTERIRIDAYADLGEQALRWRVQVEDNRRLELQRDALPATLSRRLAQLETELLERSLDADPPQGTTFVAPYENRRGGAFAAETQPDHDTTAREAIRWVAANLYNDVGAPNAKTLWLTNRPESHGRIRIPVIGSKRGEGSADALRWLCDKRVLVKVPGGYALNLQMCPTKDDLRYVE